MRAMVSDFPARQKLVCLPILPKLRAVMAAPGIGPAELARRLGRNRQHVNEVLCGTSNIPGYGYGDCCLFQPTA